MDIGAAVTAARNNFRPLADKLVATITPELQQASRLAATGDEDGLGAVRAAASELRQAVQPFVYSRDVERALQVAIGPGVNPAGDAARMLKDLDQVRFPGPLTEHPFLGLAGRLRAVSGGAA